MSANADAQGSAQGEFSSKIQRDAPLTTSGHQPGSKHSAADNADEFHAQTLPAGSAPKDRTFQPNPSGDASVPGQADNPFMDSESATKPGDTLGGATSADVHTGYGHPGQGQTSSELRHDGQHGRKKDGQGLAQYGHSERESLGTTDSKPADPRENPKLRNQEGDVKGGQKGLDGGKALGAEEKLPETADRVAAEVERENAKKN